MPYWLWIAAGLALMIVEVFLGSFFVFWVGLAAVLVGFVVLVVPELATAAQITIWALLSGALGLAWFKYIKPLSRDRTKAGLSREALIGQVGQVLRPPTGAARGAIRFPAPILGADEWQILSEDPLAIGDRAHVTDLSGNALIVRKM
ncbi:MAG: NfeD family protein [Gammaproteobacteria bacterium]|nr:NfeD family protein [Gammaproteobacteria bacterium]MCY4182058.1 NfeD family protein [Gammaproteobacteria bacterium]MCY4269875.1 NfeD family protein [Gammaproteobacteria bacterium]